MDDRTSVFRQANEAAQEWKRILAFLQHENILQKNRLGEMLRHNGESETLLEIAEQYQTQFLQQDDAFKFMWNDLAALERSLKQKTSMNDDDVKEMLDCKKRLQKEMMDLAMNFDRLKVQFLNFFEAFAEQD